MKRFFAFLAIFLTLSSSLWSYTRFYYAEQWYSLFHRKLQERSLDYLANIYYLERALRSPFGNPRFSLTPIETKEEWEKYRYLFFAHVNLKLIEQHLLLGNQYDISRVKFYHTPFKKELLENLDKAESFYNMALTYWPEVIRWKEKADTFLFIDLEKVSYWQDELTRIEEKELDYEEIIARHLARITKAREDLNQLDQTSY